MTRPRAVRSNNPGRPRHPREVSMGRFAHVVSRRRTFQRQATDRRPRAIEPLEPRTLLAASLLDPSFGGGDGIASVDFRGGYDETADVAVLPGGKILVAATARRPDGDDASADFALARFNADGSLDTSFGTGGKVTTD